MKPKDISFDVAVVGGGPAGMMAAIRAAECGARVALIEKNDSLGKKLLLTGHGRCNITNAEENLRALVEKYGANGPFLYHALAKFSPRDVMSFFKSIGVPTKIESENRVFPESEKATDVLAALTAYLAKKKVEIIYNADIEKVVIKNKRIEKIVLSNREITAKNYILAMGGKSFPSTGSIGEGFSLAESLSHTVTELTPALAPLVIAEDWVKELQGLSLQNATVRVLQNGKKQFSKTGDFIFTHFGLSGPLVLNISKRIGDLLKSGDVKIALDLNIENSDEKLKNIFLAQNASSVKKCLAEFIPKKLIPVIGALANVDTEKAAHHLTKLERQTIAQLFRKIEMTVTSLQGFDVAMATSGGISLKEIDDKTMQSKIIGNLFFAGEMIDIDAETGGYNLQAAWSTGRLAGESAANLAK